jgi:hypothetical protein
MNWNMNKNNYFILQTGEGGDIYMKILKHILGESQITVVEA